MSQSIPGNTSAGSELKPGNAPTEENRVVLSFLGDGFLADSLIDLGLHALDKTQITNNNVNVKPYSNMDDYKFIENGFQTLQFDVEDMSHLSSVFEKSKNLEPTDKFPDWQDEHVQSSINFLESWIKKKYTELTGIDNITAVCSRHLLFRLAGCNAESCQIPGNPLMHLDYISFDATYDRHCLEQQQWAIPIKCPPKKQLIDVINIWFPTTNVQDWPLGFLNINNIEIRDYVPVQLVSGSQAASIRFKEGLEAIYKENMKESEVYFFRSATKNAEKKGVVHGSFRITSEQKTRRSIELRCCIFKNLEGTGLGSEEGTGLGSAEGTGLGSEEGTGLGSEEGTGLGSEEGTGLGSEEGTGLGSAEGTGLGSEEGTGLGSAKGSAKGGNSKKYTKKKYTKKRYRVYNKTKKRN
uniref:Uncharacterized protein n=1 Tax=viral metagenome TaxID=1070528 RepID=A0A6C0B2K1_9ZZZZ